MARYGVLLQDAVGRTRTVYVEARNQTSACNQALRKLAKEDAELSDWRPIRADDF